MTKPSRSSSAKLTENSAAVKLIRKNLRSGKISKSTTPLQVYNSEKEFSKHKLQNFRTRLKKEKRMFFGEDNTEDGMLYFPADIFIFTYINV